MVLNAAVQMLREADELKQKILKFNSGTSMLQDKTLWATQQQLQKVYQKVLVLDLDYALEKKVEQDLWNVGFKQQIEALQALSKDRKNALRSEAQAMLSWVLQAAVGFYLCLLHQICTTFKLDLPFRRRASLLGAVEGWEASAGAGAGGAGGAGAARYASQHCLVHLGDLARYRHQLRVAHSFYRHALAVSVHSGQPYNQLALVAWRRGRRLAAVYWHVRSLLVRAPFPPAPANLARTLAAAASRDVKEAPALPVLPGLPTAPAQPADVPERLDSYSYVNELVRVLHYLHTAEQLEVAEELVNTLGASLSPLVATDSFDSMTLIKMACVIIWAVHSTTEDFSLEASALSEAEATAAQLASSLAAASLLSLLLPVYTSDELPQKALPALKVWLQWLVSYPKALGGGGWAARPQLWAALAHTLNKLAATSDTDNKYASVPLPEDEELHGFVPLEEGFEGLKFVSHSDWDYAKVPDVEPSDEDVGSAGVSSLSLIGEPELEQRVRAGRLLRLGRRLAERHPSHLSYTTSAEGELTFAAHSVDGAQLAALVARLQPPAARTSTPSPLPPPPVIISEADFREKVREKRVGILKPQGSLERAREERALATTLEEPESENSSEGSKSEDKKEARKARVNIAMAAIMRKQEETNKQVKFVTPPPTPESLSEPSESQGSETPKDETPKVIQPKAIKSLANIPVGRKTGGILSLKDKSAGYPHLQNTEPEPKKPEKEEKKEVKSNQSSNANSQNHQQKREQATNWPNPSAPSFNETPRMTIQKNYGIQNVGMNYNPCYQMPSPNSQGIRLPVVNPKEIDVRTAALQKQNSRQDLFQDGHKFANQVYQLSGDKKNFMNDLPPRFANQYRYWQNSQDTQYIDNKFRDDNLKNVNMSTFNAQQQQQQPPRQNWQPQQNESFQQPASWWKPENQTNFNPQPFSAPPMNYYSSLPTNMPNPYTNMQFNQGQTLQNIGQNAPNMVQNIQNLNLGQSKPDLAPSYVQSAIGQPQIQTLQNLVASPNFNSTLNSFAPYAPAVTYDASMYPQFNKLGYQPMPMKMMDKPNYPGAKELDVGLNYGANVLELQTRNYETFGAEGGAMKPSEDAAGVSAAGEGSTYSLFSGAPDAPAWPPRSPHQSLWSGPGPSPLERLLEQQKQMQQPPAPQ
ncbi:nonsense-mediated mRNA decay factor SMG7 isoform X2 [Bicyclus anynana]|uniref:Nonsense-mediated mRNA decay factor SMG7 isoform X2 n=1 Tax=Bicyclus anynana TaxID=110368 RepID=A0A6J1P2A4_BICAN|nr:nonsense-mediated mRNA decay factor SMG7 isoform X2 [Bicyclus anynana]